jgi:hypothetical protein
MKYLTDSSIETRWGYSACYVLFSASFVIYSSTGSFESELSVMLWRLMNGALFLMFAPFIFWLVEFHRRRKMAGKSSFGHIALAFFLAPLGIIVLCLLEDDEAGSHDATR